MKLKCQCCGIEAEFADGEAAFEAGWDAPPHFTGYVCCNLCPAVAIILNMGHTKAHAHWAEHGRPDDFGADCVTDKRWGEPMDPAVQALIDLKKKGDKSS